MSINLGVLYGPGAEAYFTKSDPRIRCGCRATLEALGIPLPDWAKRKPTGPKPGRAIAAAFRADNPETLHQATMRRKMELTRQPAANPAAADAPASLSDRLAAVKAALPQSTTYSHDPDVDPLTL